MTTPIPRGNGRNGTWAPWVAHTPEPEYRPYWAASVGCPRCGVRMSLARHSIAPDGTVTPSIGHPEGVPDCGWHPAPGVLVGWPEVLTQSLPAVPAISTCERCGKQSHTIGGWSTWSGGAGIICDGCAREHVAAARGEA